MSAITKKCLKNLIGNGKAAKVLKAIQEYAWFSDHLIMHSTYRKVVWQKPNTSIYKIVYLIEDNRLFVYGDLGDAVYSWSERISWKFLHDMCFSYFHSKCCASEHGLPWLDWCASTCAEDLRVAGDEERLNEEEFQECIQYADHEQTWRNFVFEESLPSTTYDKIQPEELISFGYAPALRCVGHWYGLQLVTYQMKKDKLHAWKDLSSDFSKHDG